MCDNRLSDAHNDGANEDDPSPSCGSEPQPREERYDRDKEGTNRDGGRLVGGQSNSMSFWRVFKFVCLGSDGGWPV